MADALKNMYNPAFFESLCPALKKTIPGFDCRDFIIRVFNNQWPELELKERVRHIAITLNHFLGDDFKRASSLLINLSRTLIKNEFPEQGFAVIFIPEYIAVFGTEHPDESLAALEEITKLVSAEFAIRPFLQLYPEKTIKQMLEWSKNADANVRRLASEGCRPRLPWGMGIATLKKDPSSIIPILENLKADPSEYVRRSVANNLNDIAKDHKELVLNIAKKWSGKNSNTNWIIKHGCRTLLKKGDQQALSLHGFDPSSRGKISYLTLSKKKIKIGDRLNFGFDFVNHEKAPKNFRLEYAIDFLTSTGRISRKIFKITENNYVPGKAISIERNQSFKDLTTRKHFKGKHFITILANGKKLAEEEFMLI